MRERANREVHPLHRLEPADREHVVAGLPAVQVREKDLGAADLAFVCRRLAPAAREAGAMLVVNDRVDVALAVGADAVQRTHASLTVDDIRSVAPSLEKTRSPSSARLSSASPGGPVATV